MRRPDPWLVAGAVLCGLLLFVAAYGDRIAPNEPLFLMVNGPPGTDRPLPPGEPLVFGSDALGRDLFSLVLVGARPGQGKTLMSLELAVEAMKSGHRAAFFSLEYTERDVLDRLRAIGVDPVQFDKLFEVDCSDAISADYVVKQMAAAPRGTVVVIDYLQLLDQRRENPDLTIQVRALKSFARDKGLIVVFISQIDRSYDPSLKPCPDLDDVRLPNPLDLKLFDKTCFLNKDEVQFRIAS
jgi:replicative DNA helicase